MSTDGYSGASTTATGDQDDGPASEKNYWAVCIALFACVTVFGNVLVCLAVLKERNLRNITNYFIVSLAVADLLVGLVVMPGAIYVEVNLGAWYLGNKLCDFWVALDVMLCTASIFNLTAISIDRLYAVTKPLAYARQRPNQRIAITIATVWIISFVISCPILFGANDVPGRIPELCILFNGPYMIWSSVFSFVIPAVTMVIVYTLVYVAIRNRVKRVGATENTIIVANKTDVSDLTPSDEQAREPTEQHSDQLSRNLASPGHNSQEQTGSNRNPDKTDLNRDKPVPTGSDMPTANKSGRNSIVRHTGGQETHLGQMSKKTVPVLSQRQKFSMRKERKATKTLAIVLGVFLFCWIPFFTLNIMFGACPTCSVPSLFIQFALWIGYINSTMNPVIYTVFNMEFRRAFQKLVSC